MFGTLIHIISDVCECMGAWYECTSHVHYVLPFHMCSAGSRCMSHVATWAQFMELDGKSLKPRVPIYELGVLNVPYRVT